MLFHVTHSHDFHTCITHLVEASNIFKYGFTKVASANKVILIAPQNNRAHHTSIALCGPHEYHAVDKALEPILKFGNYDIMPVSAM